MRHSGQQPISEAPRQRGRPKPDAACVAFPGFRGKKPGVIRIFVSGGTFDKEYNELTGSLFFKDTHLPEMLRLGRCRAEVAVSTLMMIDSLDMTEADRASIVERCRQAVESRIVVTHGTDTMVETAAALATAMPAASGKTIVLTGAMIPYAFGSSDGLFNLGSALSFVQALAPGVYVAMNGRCFEWNGVRKNRETGVFEAI
jgi:L-asparaginase